jgi:hypothetical protein
MPGRFSPTSADDFSLVGEICGSLIRSNGSRQLGSRSPRTRCGKARLQRFAIRSQLPFVPVCLSAKCYAVRAFLAQVDTSGRPTNVNFPQTPFKTKPLSEIAVATCGWPTTILPRQLGRGSHSARDWFRISSAEPLTEPPTRIHFCVSRRYGLAGSFSAVSSPNNQVLAIFQSRLAVSGEIPRASAVSSTLSPPK